MRSKQIGKTMASEAMSKVGLIPILEPLEVHTEPPTEIQGEQEQTEVSFVARPSSFAEFAELLATRMSGGNRVRIRVRDILSGVGKARRGSTVSRRLTKALLRHGLILSRPLGSA